MKLQAKFIKLYQMLFLLKKIVASLLLPLPIALILLLIGLGLVAWTKARKTGIGCLCAGILVILLFSTNPIAGDLIHALQKRYHPLTRISRDVKYIVVLGGGNGSANHYPPNTQLSSASLSRLIEGIRLYRQHPHTLLVLSGGRVFGSRADANVMNNTAVALGVARQQMIIKSGSQDTQAEAKHLKPLLKQRPFVLVTSAYHMSRAMEIFKKYGMHPIPAPTQFLTKPTRSNPKYYFPTIVNLTHSDIALHEYLGLLWLRLNGRHPVTALRHPATSRDCNKSYSSSD